MIRTVLFDLDNTLFDFTKAEGIAPYKNSCSSWNKS